MFRAIVPRNCNTTLGLMNSVRGMKIDARPILNNYRSPSQITKRCRSDLSPWSMWHSRSPFRNFDREIGRFVNEMERSMFPWTSQMGMSRPGSARVWNNKKEFEVNVDVHHFEPENIHVKLSNNILTISGKHESKQDEHGYVSREFTRSFTVPEKVDAETMTSSITEDGVLVIRAKVKPDENPKDKTVNIEIERDNASSGSIEDKK